MRAVESAPAERLRVMPAVVVTGARKTGKSTLVAERLHRSRRYESLDDHDVLDAARRDPKALAGRTKPVTLDEVQREPTLLASVKRAVDRGCKPLGRLPFPQVASRRSPSIPPLRPGLRACGEPWNVTLRRPRERYTRPLD